MAYHHLAFATHDMLATDLFYSQAMGFELEKVEIAKTPGGGHAKHFFYSTGGGGMIAFWELHDPSLPSDFPTGLSEAAGLPAWVNHVAFEAGSVEGLEIARKRWLETGYDVLEIDHGWCRSVYTTDPNRTLVEFCVTLEAFGPGDRQAAREALTRDDLPFSPEPKIEIHRTGRERPIHEADSAGSADSDDSGNLAD